MKLIKKILVANRGEIAVRIRKSAKELGIRTVFLYTDEEKNEEYLNLADERYLLEGDKLSETYLNIDQILLAAKNTGADAIHPGYGFLSENADFAHRVIEAGLTWIGPAPELISLMGEKTEARNVARKYNIPVVTQIEVHEHGAPVFMENIDFPLLVKAVGGGGGRGMRRVNEITELEEAVEIASNEANIYFGDPRIYLEKYIDGARHIEVQVLGDKHGNVIHLYERECTIQRKYQKIIEEAPAVSISESVRTAIHNYAITLARGIGYDNAGTVEFLVDKNGHIYFIEMNTRIQVEHPVTEQVTGVDLVKEQILISSRFPLNYTQEKVRLNGHAIEARIYAENPLKDNTPDPGTVQMLKFNENDFVRLESSLTNGSRVLPNFDSMIAKIAVWGNTREEALTSIKESLSGFIIAGFQTNIPLLKQILNHRYVLDNQLDTRFFDNCITDISNLLLKQKENLVKAPLVALYLFSIEQKFRLKSRASVWYEIGYWRHDRKIELNIDGKKWLITDVCKSENQLAFKHDDHLYKAKFIHCLDEQMIFEINGERCSYFYKLSDYELITIVENFEIKVGLWNMPGKNEFLPESKSAYLNQHILVAPITGSVIKVEVKMGQPVQKGELLVRIESMKMEQKLLSPIKGIVGAIHTGTGEQVKENQKLIEIV